MDVDDPRQIVVGVHAALSYPCVKPRSIEKKINRLNKLFFQSIEQLFAKVNVLLLGGKKLATLNVLPWDRVSAIRAAAHKAGVEITSDDRENRMIIVDSG